MDGPVVANHCFGGLIEIRENAARNTGNHRGADCRRFPVRQRPDARIQDVCSKLKGGALVGEATDEGHLLDRQVAPLQDG